jgi:hypothetical protein
VEQNEAAEKTKRKEKAIISHWMSCHQHIWGYLTNMKKKIGGDTNSGGGPDNIL